MTTVPGINFIRGHKWQDDINTLWPEQSRYHYADEILKCIFLDNNIDILFQIALKSIPWSTNDNKSTMVQVMCQANTQTNDDPINWCIYASPGLNELSVMACYQETITSSYAHIPGNIP